MSMTFDLWREEWSELAKEKGWDAVDALAEYKARPHDLDVNLANGNAWQILRLLGVEPDHCGLIPRADLPALMRRLIKAKNVQRLSRSLDRPYEETGGPGTGQCRMVDFGNTEEQTQRRLSYLEPLVKYAIDNGYDLSWG